MRLSRKMGLFGGGAYTWKKYSIETSDSTTLSPGWGVSYYGGDSFTVDPDTDHFVISPCETQINANNISNNHYMSDSTESQDRWEKSQMYYAISYSFPTYTVSILTLIYEEEIRGTKRDQYPENGYHTDGYYYVLLES